MPTTAPPPACASLPPSWAIGTVSLRKHYSDPRGPRGGHHAAPGPVISPPPSLRQTLSGGGPLRPRSAVAPKGARQGAGKGDRESTSGEQLVRETLGASVAAGVRLGAGKSGVVRLVGLDEGSGLTSSSPRSYSAERASGRRWHPPQKEQPWRSDLCTNPDQPFFLQKHRLVR